MKQNLLIIAQKVDQNDDHRGFFIDWLKEFGKNFKEVNVITLATGTHNFPSNIRIYSLGKERGDSKLIQAVRFYKYLFHFVPNADGIFAHASPIFVIASWPAAFLFRKKIVLWYLHRSVTWKLKLAEKMCYKIVTASKESLGFKSDKVFETGHGINVGMFKTERSWESKAVLNLLTVGRVTPIKNLETLIKAVSILRDKEIKFHLKIVGQPAMPNDYAYQEKLKQTVQDSGLSDEVEFVGFVPYSELSRYYKEADVFVNLLSRGGIDKALLEAMASGCLVLTSNTIAGKYLGHYSNRLIFKHGDPKNLSENLLALKKLTNEDKIDVSTFLTRSVSNTHRLENVITKITSLL